VSFSGKNMKLDLGITCANESDAVALKKTLGQVQLLVNLASLFVPKEAGKAVTGLTADVSKSLKVQNKGPLATASLEISEATLQELKGLIPSTNKVGDPPVGKLPVGEIPGGKFKEFKSAAGGFTAQMPGNPKQQSQNIPGGGILTAYLVEERDGAYMVGYSDIPIAPNESEAQLQNRLDGSRDGAVRNLNATVVRDVKIKLAGKHPGREIEANLPQNKGVMRARFYIVGSRMYQVMVLGTRAWVGAPTVTAFLDSFALTK
jgi:hypothetical protein